MRKKCYTDWHMRNLTTMLCVFVVAACAVGASLPVPDFADAGASTNIVFAASSMPGAVTFALEFAPTPTNNVEIALGVDEDGNGALSEEEECLTIGWDCGMWFVRRGAGEEYEYSAATDGTAQVFSWRLTTLRGGVPSRLVATVDNTAVFSDISANPPRWLYDTSWDMARVIVRGAGVEGSVAPVKVSVAGTVFYMR